MQRTPFVVVLILCTVKTLAASPARRVEIVAAVPPVAQVDAPHAIALAPGETRTVAVRVACNQSWLVTLHSDNPLVRSVGRRAGKPGGMTATGHDFTVTLTCAATAPGPQYAQLATQVVTGALVAGVAN